MELDIIAEIKDKNINVEYFAERIIHDEILRRNLVKQMVCNKDIMVYYHCYYIVAKACELRPDLFYEYWPEFAELLNHQNSYHRDIGLTLIASLVSVDDRKYFDEIFYNYLLHINDKKFMTSQYCLRNLGKILKARRDLLPMILNRLLSLDEIVTYPHKQIELLKAEVLDILDSIYSYTDYRINEINTFILNSQRSISPKTRKKARMLVKKYAIN